MDAANKEGHYNSSRYDNDGRHSFEVTLNLKARHRRPFVSILRYGIVGDTESLTTGLSRLCLVTAVFRNSSIGLKRPTLIRACIVWSGEVWTPQSIHYLSAPRETRRDTD